MPSSLPITPGARRAGRLCVCGHRAGLHGYCSGSCIATTGLGHLAKRCTCTKFTEAKPTHSQPTKTQSHGS